MQMNSKERILTTLNHQEPDRVAVDFGSNAVTGMHVRIVEMLRDHFNLEKRPVKVCEPYQMLGEVEEDLLEKLGVDTVGLLAPGLVRGRNETSQRDHHHGGRHGRFRHWLLRG